MTELTEVLGKIGSIDSTLKTVGKRFDEHVKQDKEDFSKIHERTEKIPLIEQAVNNIESAIVRLEVLGNKRYDKAEKRFKFLEDWRVKIGAYIGVAVMAAGILGPFVQKIFETKLGL